MAIGYALTFIYRCAYNVGMDKHFILSYFGGVVKTATAIDIKPSSVSEWPDQLPFSAVGRIALKHPKALAAWHAEKRRHKKAA